jgi:hypothetical protein
MPKPKAKADAGDKRREKNHTNQKHDERQVSEKTRRLHFPHILIKPKKIENTQNKWRIKTFHSAIHLPESKLEIRRIHSNKAKAVQAEKRKIKPTASLPIH